MKFYGKAEQTGKRIIQAFQDGSAPKALSQVLIKGAGAHCDSWSFNNQFLVALMGYGDAMGYRQWQALGRNVKRGEKAFYILAPCTRKFTESDDEPGEEKERVAVVGFRGVPVFGLEQTDGKPLESEKVQRRVLDSLPLLNVAEKWGLNVRAFDSNGRRLGFYSPGSTIGVGTENASTWAHELVHAAEDRLGALGDDRRTAEIAAELGGATLLWMLGRNEQADIGAAYKYVSSWCGQNDAHKVARACTKVLDRVCRAVSLILEESARTPACASPACASPHADRHADREDSLTLENVA